ncbi:MAG: pyridoxamine 5'-phosphate oxidase family protein [Candidatus Bathyarchaeia archaeon]|jgi:nitroimidazol reductase NimA-like FMN-containing flavoprotein (pyridoxamine 5'-phosphate oxidase superfamily)
MVSEFSEKQKVFIASQGVLRFNSLTADGQIHSVPLCFAFDGRNFYVHCGNTGAKRWRNLKKNNVVSVELDSYVDDWSGNKGLLVYGKAVFLQPGQEEQRKGISLLKEKYVQYREKFKLNDSTVIVKLEPSKIMNWFL